MDPLPAAVARREPVGETMVHARGRRTEVLHPVDLKLGKLTHQDIGQMDSYVRMFEAHAKPAGDNPTIGLILCSKKNEAVAKYSVLSDGRKIFAAKYLDYLPTEEQLQRELERERRLLEKNATRARRPKGTR